MIPFFCKKNIGAEADIIKEASKIIKEILLALYLQKTG